LNRPLRLPTRRKLYCDATSPLLFSLHLDHLNPPPAISIITPCFNSQATIRDTIKSVLAQDYEDWEHLVMDGGSTDDTTKILAEYRHLNCVSEKDAGHYDAMNKGIARARGEFIVILNADDTFRPSALRHVATAFAQHPEWDALFGDVIYVDDQGREIYRRAEACYDYQVLLYAVDYICHQTLFVRRQIYDRLGGYRQKDFRNSADYEFKLRLGQQRCRVGHVPQYLVDYRYHAHGQSADQRITRNMIREAEIIKREHGHPGGWLGRLGKIFYKAKRQAQKIRYRGHCDLIPGTWKLRPHMKSKTEFSSNSGLDKLAPH
jgi:glycosyltransferase involved in cell wall biosynthesis